jgi:signal peptide peptidase SppA
MDPLPTIIDLSPVPALDIDQYCGLWAVEEGRFGELLRQVAWMDLASHVAFAAHDRSISDARLSVQNGRGIPAAQPSIAVLDFIGVLTKRGSSLSSAGSMIRARQAVRAAGADPAIAAIALRIDSPGGTSAGTADLARDIAKAAQSKPVWAYVEDMAASAAYWVASQTGRIVANDRTALVGSIGTYMGLYDLSGAAAQRGIKAIVIRSGPYKGAGFEGAEITDAQKAYWQLIVDKTQAEFSAAVSAGRRMAPESVAQLADGRVHMAADALSLGLIDAIQSWDEFLAALSAAAIENQKSRTALMSTESAITPSAPASYADLKAGLPGADAGFLCEQLEVAATLAAAQTAWMAEQDRRIRAAQAETAQAKLAASAAGLPTLGGATAAGALAGETGSDAVEAWQKALAEKLTACNGDRARAVRQLVRENPSLHADFVAASNAK